MHERGNKNDNNNNNKAYNIKKNKKLAGEKDKKEKINNFAFLKESCKKKEYNTKNIFVKKNQIDNCKLNKYFKICYYKSIMPFVELFLFYFLFLNNLLTFIITQKIKYRNLQSINEIVIKISGGDSQRVLSSSFSGTSPNRILVEGVNKIFDFSYTISDLENGENFVTLQWDSESEPKKYLYLFKDLNNLIEVDFSNFVFLTTSSLNYAFQNCKNLIKVTFNKELIKDKTFSFTSAFQGCSSLEFIDLSIFSISKISAFGSAFRDCTSLASINLRNIDTSLVYSLNYMFYNCMSLTSLDLSDFNSSSVTTMANMFEKCSKLESLNLSNFDSSKLITVASMFKGCTLLKYIDLPNFNTIKLTMMSSMFDGCSSLTSLKMPSWNTSGVKSIQSMFYGCSSLISVDLSTFDTGQVTSMSNMFYNCKSLASLNISNFDTPLVTDMSNMFYFCESLTSLNQILIQQK